MGKQSKINIGNKYGMLTVVSVYEGCKEGVHDKFLCKCECGNEAVVQAGHLLSSHTKSCGCIQKKVASERLKTHGKAHTKIYEIWSALKSRCNNPNNKRYNKYGGRGIKVCDEWNKSFEAFYNWSINNGYSDTLSIDRIDVNGNYEPSNCRWTTNKEQCRNRTNNFNITYKEQTKTLSEWAEVLGISYKILYQRIKAYGWPIEKAFTKPVRGALHAEQEAARCE